MSERDNAPMTDTREQVERDRGMTYCGIGFTAINGTVHDCNRPLDHFGPHRFVLLPREGRERNEWFEAQ